MTDIEFEKALKWQIFVKSFMESTKVYRVTWLMPDNRWVTGASIHHDMNELIDFSRRAVIEKIGCAASAIKFIIEEQSIVDDDEYWLEVYDSSKAK